MFTHDNFNVGQGQPAELVIGQGQLLQVTDWPDVWAKLGEATRALPWSDYIAWVLFDHGGEIIAATADSNDTFVARYGKGPAMMEVLYGLQY